jgi:hypothetical protein
LLVRSDAIVSSDMATLKGPEMINSSSWAMHISCPEAQNSEKV